MRKAYVDKWATCGHSRGLEGRPWSGGLVYWCASVLPYCRTGVLGEPLAAVGLALEPEYHHVHIIVSLALSLCAFGFVS